MMDVKYQKQKNQYESVNKLYITGPYTIGEACKKVGICRKTYYNIKKKINENENENDNQNIQKGGCETIKKLIVENKSNIINNEYKTTNDILKGSFQDKLKKIQNI